MQAITWLPQDPEGASNLLPSFEGYSKIQGMLLCRVCSLPTIRGLVVDPHQVIETELIEAAKKLHPSHYLVRHDRSPEIGHYPQGGYIVRLEDLASEIEWYRQNNRLVILFEPADALRNRYSAGCVIASDGVVQIEIVGPGFDASDLNRGVVSPLESYSYHLDEFGRLREISHYAANADVYTEAKDVRVRKIALKFLRHEHFANIETITSADARRELAGSALLSLPQIKDLLGDSNYQPAPLKFVRKIVNFAQTIHDFLSERAKGGSIAFSASEIDDGARISVWDIVFPSRKYQLN